METTEKRASASLISKRKSDEDIFGKTGLCIKIYNDRMCNFRTPSYSPPLILLKSLKYRSIIVSRGLKGSGEGGGSKLFRETTVSRTADVNFFCLVMHIYHLNDAYIYLYMHDAYIYIYICIIQDFVSVYFCKLYQTSSGVQKIRMYNQIRHQTSRR